MAKYPGPFFAKFSAWPAFYHTLGGDRHIWIWQCHQLYGPVFRYRPDGVLFNFPSAQRTIYESKANVQKGKFYAIWTRKADAINTWASINKTDHARKRRILNAAFSDRALKSAEPFIIRHVDRWCQRLLEGSEKDKGWSQPKNMADWSDYLVFDILGDLCYGRSFDTKEPGDSNLKLVPKFIHDYVTFMYPVRVADLRR